MGFIIVIFYLYLYWTTYMHIIGFSKCSSNQRTTLILCPFCINFGCGVTVVRGKHGGYLGLVLPLYKNATKFLHFVLET